MRDGELTRAPLARPWRRAGLLAAALCMAMPAHAETLGGGRVHASSRAAAQRVSDFSRARGNAPLWLAPTAGDAAGQLLALLRTASVDGLDPGRYHVEALEAAIRSAQGGDRDAMLRADRQLSEAFALYVRDLRSNPGDGITFVDAALRPTPPSPRAALLQAASEASLSSYVAQMGWMHPIYDGLRK